MEPHKANNYKHHIRLHTFYLDLSRSAKSRNVFLPLEEIFKKNNSVHWQNIQSMHAVLKLVSMYWLAVIKYNRVERFQLGNMVCSYTSTTSVRMIRPGQINRRRFCSRWFNIVVCYAIRVVSKRCVYVYLYGWPFPFNDHHNRWTFGMTEASVSSGIPRWLIVWRQLDQPCWGCCYSIDIWYGKWRVHNHVVLHETIS